MRSSNKIADRKVKYPTLGGPRKYPSKYVWQINNNQLEIVEVRYFNNGYYFFHYENGSTKRTKRVPNDITMYKTRNNAFRYIPKVNEREL